MVHWIGHWAGLRNLYRPCPDCGDDVQIDELELHGGRCRQCDALKTTAQEMAAGSDTNQEEPGR